MFVRNLPSCKRQMLIKISISFSFAMTVHIRTSGKKWHSRPKFINHSGLSLSMAMDIVSFLETPPIFVRLLIRLTLSLFASILSLRYSKTLVDKRSYASFDIDPLTGFFPSKPLHRLSGQYSIWEVALDNARGKLSLGEDESEQAVAKRQFGEQWRADIGAVRLLLFLCSSTARS